MKKNLVFILSLMCYLGITSCNNANRDDASKEVPLIKTDSVVQDNVEVENERSTVYTCSKHSEVIKEIPGICPKCKMTLVEATD